MGCLQVIFFDRIDKIYRIYVLFRRKNPVNLVNPVNI